MNASSYLAEIPLANLQLALEQPVFPGKLIFATLLVLSVAGWVLICTKFIFLRKQQRADAAFDLRLDRSRYLMEVYQEEKQDEASPASLHHEIYLHGAEEAVAQMASAEVASTARSGDGSGDSARIFTDRQLAALRESLRVGKSVADARLASGLFALQAIAAVAPLIGAAGMFWTLQQGFATAGTFAEAVPAVSASLLYVILALAVVAPIAVFRLVFLHLNTRRSRELDEFRHKLGYVFEEDFTDQHAFRPMKRKEQTPPPLPDEEDGEAMGAAEELAPPANELPREAGEKETEEVHEEIWTESEFDWGTRTESEMAFETPASDLSAPSEALGVSAAEDECFEIPLPERSMLGQQVSPEEIEAQLESGETPGTDHEQATAVFHAENEVEVKYKKPGETKKRFHSIRSPRATTSGASAKPDKRWDPPVNPIAERTGRQVTELESH